MTLTPRERRIGIATAAVAGIAIAHAFLIAPFLERWRAVEAERVALAEAVDRSRELASRVEPLGAEWRKLEAAMGRGADGDAVPTFLSHLRERGQAAGLSPKDIHFLRVEGQGDFDEVLFEIRVRAPLKVLSRFLYELRESDAFLKVSRLSVVAPSDGRGDLEIAMTISTILAKGRKP